MVCVVLALGLTVGGAGFAGYATVGLKQEQAEQAKTPQPPPVKGGAGTDGKNETRSPTDVHGDPLPGGAVARIGTTRLYKYHSYTQDPHLAFTPDGKMLVNCDANMAIDISDAATGKTLRRLVRVAVPLLGRLPFPGTGRH